MKHDRLRVEIDGTEVDDLYSDLVSLDVELDDQLAAMFRITVTLLPRPDGSWPYLDDDRFSLWRRVVVTAGLERRRGATDRGIHHPPAPRVRRRAGAVPPGHLGDGCHCPDGSGRPTEGLAEQEGQRRRGRNLPLLRSDPAGDRHRGDPRRERLHHHPARNRYPTAAKARVAQRLRVLRGRRYRIFRCTAGGFTATAGAGRAVRRRHHRQSLQPGGQCVDTVGRDDVPTRSRQRRRAERDGHAGQPAQPGRRTGEQLSACRDGTRTGPHRPHGDHGQRGDVRAVRGAVRPGHMVCDRAGRGGRQRIRPHPQTTAHGDHQRHRRGTQRRLLRHARDPSVHRSTATPKRFGSSETR